MQGNNQIVSNLYPKVRFCGKINPYCEDNRNLCDLKGSFDPLTLGSYDCWANHYLDGYDPVLPLWPPQYEPCPEGSRDVAGTCNKICIDTQHWPGCGIIGPAGKPCDDGTYNCQNNCWTTYSERLCGITQSLADRNKICPESHPSYAKDLGLCYHSCLPGFHRRNLECIPDGTDYLGADCYGDCIKTKTFPWDPDYESRCEIGFKQSEVEPKYCKPDEPDKYCKFKNGPGWFASEDGNKCINCGVNATGVICENGVCTCTDSSIKPILGIKPKPPLKGYKYWYLYPIQRDMLTLILDSTDTYFINNEEIIISWERNQMLISSKLNPNYTGVIIFDKNENITYGVVNRPLVNTPYQVKYTEE